LLDSMVRVFSFVRNNQTLPKWLFRLTFPLAMNENSSHSISSLAFDVIYALNFGCSIKYIVLISLMT
jgi:hypothetical protein